MKKKTKYLNKVLIAVLFVLLLNVMGMTRAWALSFTSGNLWYSVSSTANHTVRVTGHVDSMSAIGEVVIPETVEYDGVAYAVTEIYLSAFQECSGLTSITIPNSVIFIDSYAFYGCSSLSSLEIPGSVTFIDLYAFNGCSGLEQIVVGQGNPVYDSRDNCNAIVKTNTNTLISGCKNTIIPNSITTIGQSAFTDCRSLTSVTIPNSVTSIRESAFSGCSGLASIVIPNSVTQIWHGAFSGCSGLTSILIPNSVIEIGSGAFSGCSGFTSIEIPSTVTFIGDGAFSGCSGLGRIIVEQGNPVYDSRDNCNAIVETGTNTLLTGCKNTIIPHSIIGIGQYAFRDCSSLTSIEIPSSVTVIDDNQGINGYSIFSGCNSLERIVVEQGNPVYDSRDNCNAIIKTSTNELFAGCKNTVIPNTVISIGKGAFGHCSSLTSIIIPYSVTRIGENAFGDCSNLTSIIIPNSITEILYFGDYIHPFIGCTGLQEIKVEPGNPVFDSRENCNAIIGSNTNTLMVGCKTTVVPNSVTRIGYRAFYGCNGLNSIEIPNSVTSIAEHAFESCSSLTSVALGNSLTSIGTCAFWGCSSLTGELIIPNSVTTIGGSAFWACTSLTSLTIGNSVTSIGCDAFRACTDLTSIVVMTSTPPTLDWNYGGGSIFGGVSKNIPVYVPCGSIGAYQVARGWDSFTNYHEFSTAYDLIIEVEDPAHCQIVTDQLPLCTTGETVVRAIPSQGYHFVAWFENGIAMSTNPVYTVYLNQNRRLVAKVQQGTGTEEHQTTGFEVYPNPSQGYITVEGYGLLKVSNLLGQDILTKEINGQTTLDLPRGVYLFTLGRTTRKIVVE
ncbi:MAG: leucine-rich repeat domain-containing protein [Prevotella sp.]|nr:leucine-rich repeat domain-containing protein [Prevotella sp.]